jgi:hypothetical protein
MWEPQPLTILRAFKACRGENFTLPLYKEINDNRQEMEQDEVYLTTKIF